MIKYLVKQNNVKNSPINGQWFAYPVIEETIELDALATHMANHNTPYSPGAIKGMLTDMIICIKELLLQGKNVKLPNLAIFSIGIKNKKGGAGTDTGFATTQHIDGVKLRARATGTLTTATLNLEATLKRASTSIVKKLSQASSRMNPQKAVAGNKV